MKRTISLLLVFLILLSVIYGCDGSSDVSSNTSSDGRPTDRLVYPYVSANWMFYTLTEACLDELTSAVEECRKIYDTADETKAEELKKSLYYAANIYNEITTQYDIAYVKYQCDYSNEKAKNNYDNALKIQESAGDILWDFWSVYVNSDNPLSEMVLNFRDENYRSTSLGDLGSEYQLDCDSIISQFDSVKNTATDDELLGLYKDFLLSGNLLANEAGYNNYYEYANSEKYNRNSLPQDNYEVRNYAKQYLVPLAEAYSKKSDDADEALSAEEFHQSVKYSDYNYDSFKEDYIGDYIKSLGRLAEKGMGSAFTENNIITSNRSNANKIAFCYKIGNTPFCYFHKSDMTLETVTHELGHYYFSSVKPFSEYHSNDIKEVHSMANTLLFTLYTGDRLNTSVFDAYEISILDNLLYQAVSSAIHDEFNSVIFDEDIENLTVERIEEILLSIMEDYGVTDWGDRFKKQILTYWKRHGMSNAGYHISYVTAAVVALQIYNTGLTDYGQAVEYYEGLIHNDYGEGIFKNAVTAIGLYPPTDENAYLSIQSLIDYEFTPTEPSTPPPGSLNLWYNLNI